MYRMSSHDTNYQKSIIIFAVTVFAMVGAFGGGIIVGSLTSGNTTPASTAANVAGLDNDYINNILGILEDEYLGEIPDQTVLTQGAAKGIIDALGDQYSGYLNPEESEAYFQSNDSAYEGIGVQLAYTDGFTMVEVPIDGSPGTRAGLSVGDLILRVDDKDVQGERPEIVASHIRGEAGTDVTIEIYRPSTLETLEFVITREQIDLDNISYREIEDGIFVIDIVKFTEGSKGLLSGSQVFNNTWDEIVAKVAAQNPKGVVVDLRGNPGGFVTSVLYVAEEFLQSGDIIMREQVKNEPETFYNDSRQGELESVPVVVLVNEASASAAEILAAAIQENDRGEVIGQPTVGKGVEQRLVELDDSALLLIVFKNWLTPLGNHFSAESPVQPDELIEYEAVDGVAGDTQMQRALELLKK